MKTPKNKNTITTRMSRKTKESISKARIKNNIRQKKYRNKEATLKKKKRSLKDKYHKRAKSNQFTTISNNQIIFNENTVEKHFCGDLIELCPFEFCKALHFPSEKLSKNCCHNGKVRVTRQTYPEFLKNLISNPEDPNYCNFRQHIRSYNSSMSFASMGGKIIRSNGVGPYCFKIHGQTYHQTSHMFNNSNTQPKYAQLYILDTSIANEHRLKNLSNQGCLPQLLTLISNFFATHNIYAKSYKMMADVEKTEIQHSLLHNKKMPNISLVLNRDRYSKNKNYDSQYSNEIAIVFTTDDGSPPFNRDFRVYSKHSVDPDNKKGLINLSILSPNLDPMVYPLLFPFGEPGWQPNLKGLNGSNISMLQFKVSQTAIRETFNPVMRAGKLTLQWIVDSYIQSESNKLNYIDKHQSELRSATYHELLKWVSDEAHVLNVSVGRTVILPSSFQGLASERSTI